ncbi:MAG: DUF5777 family beta-barrel protein [Bacteroidales bacterium]|nr:DUF5777 family beta-barrel protein [Bacteroidales bacterium]
MKKIFSLLLIAFIAIPMFSQEEEEDYPVMFTFEAGILADNQTIMTPYKGMIEFQIHHRFGEVTNGHQSLFGIYSPSNIRLGPELWYHRQDYGWCRSHQGPEYMGAAG